MVKKLLIQLLRKIADDLDAGNSNIDESEAMDAMNYINKLTHSKELTYTRIEAARYLGVSETKFNYLRNKKLIGDGSKKAGDVRRWTKKELDDYISNNKS